MTTTRRAEAGWWVHRRVRLLTVPCVGVLVFGGLTTAASAARFPPVPHGPILLGVSATLSGPLAAGGQQTVDLLENVALRQFASQNPNGIEGHPVKLEVVDDQGTVTGAIAAAHELVADKVAAVVATAGSSPAAASDQLAIFAKARVPVIGADTGSPQFANVRRFPFFFGTGVSETEEAQAAARWIKRSGFTRMAVLSDETPSSQAALHLIVAATRKVDPDVKVVRSIVLAPFPASDHATMTALESANPQLLLSALAPGSGAMWRAMKDVNWSPAILSASGLWYENVGATAGIPPKAYAVSGQCAPSVTTAYSAATTALMAGYRTATDGRSADYLAYIAADTVPLDLVKYSVDKEHSDAPAAIRMALQGMRNTKFFGIDYAFSTTRHFGIEGAYGAAVCHVDPPYAGGVGQVPVRSFSASAAS